MAMGIWGGVALVAAILAGVLTLLVYSVGLVTTLSIAFIIICLIMMLIILAQKPTGGGLSGAFGGAGGGGSQTAFGAKTGDVMTWSTIVLFVLFISVAMSLTWTTAPATAPDPNAPITANQPLDPSIDHTGHDHGDLNQTAQPLVGDETAPAAVAPVDESALQGETSQTPTSKTAAPAPVATPAAPAASAAPAAKTPATPVTPEQAP